MVLIEEFPATKPRRRTEPLRAARVTDGRRRMPAGQAFLTILAALLIAAVLGADSLEQVAERQNYGLTRDVALAITRPLRAVSHALFLDRPREWLADATNHQDPPTSPKFESGDAPSPTSSTTSSSSTSTSAATSTTAAAQATTTTVPPSTTTTLPPRRVPTPEAPLRTYFAGDSLIGNISEAFFRMVSGDPRVTLGQDVQVSTGLVRTDVLNWADQLRADLAANDPEVVYLIFGANDDQPLRDPDGNYLSLFSPEWALEYERRVGVMMDLASEGGKRTVVWIGLPSVRPEQLNVVKDAINVGARRQALLRPDVYFVDPGLIFNGPDNVYQDTVVLADGTVVAARATDGVHFTHEGADLLAPALYERIADRWHLR